MEYRVHVATTQFFSNTLKNSTVLKGVKVRHYQIWLFWLELRERPNLFKHLRKVPRLFAQLSIILSISYFPELFPRLGILILFK